MHAHAPFVFSLWGAPGSTTVNSIEIKKLVSISKNDQLVTNIFKKGIHLDIS